MALIRKIIGLFIIFAVGIPVLVGIIWTAGISRSALSPEFYEEVPVRVVEEAPLLVEELIAEMKDDLRITDPNTRRWLSALDANPMKITALIEDSGMGRWLDEELTYKVGLIGEMMRGEAPYRQVRLDLVPLKEALRGPVVREYILNTLRALPPCSEEQREEWIRAITFPRDLFDLPACRPVDPKQALTALEWFSVEEYRDIPDSVPLVENLDNEDLRFLPLRVNIFKLTMVFIYLLFLIPLGIIFTGALIHGEKSRWFGVGLSVSALSAYLLLKLSLGFTHWVGFFIHQEHYLTVREEIAIDKLLSLMSHVFAPLSRNIETISGIIFLAGLAFFVFSFTRRRGNGEEALSSRPVAGSSGSGDAAANSAAGQESGEERSAAD